MKFICKKSITGIRIWFLENNSYLAANEGDSYYVTFTQDISLEHHRYGTVRFYKQRQKGTTHLYVWDYFYTQQEIRRMKLKKIEKNA